MSEPNIFQLNKFADYVRKDERDKIFSTMKRLINEEPKIYGTIDIFNVDDFQQSIIIKLNTNSGK